MAVVSDFSASDSKEFFNIYANEFNEAEMHDRVLVLDVYSDNSEIERTVISCDTEQENDVHKTELCGSTNSSASPVSTHDETSDTSMKRRLGTTDRMISLRRRKYQKHDDLTINTAESATGLSQKESKLMNQHKLYVHTSWLSVHSQYFRALFYSGLTKAHLTEAQIKIPKSEESVHLHVIEAMYRPDSLNDLSVSELLSILVLADKFDAKFVFRKCKYLLKGKVSTVKLCETIYYTVNVKHEMMEVVDLIETIETFLTQHFNPLDRKWEAPDFEILSEPLLTILLSSDRLVVSCEDVVFHALMHWLKKSQKLARNTPKGVSRYLANSPLLSVIRFNQLTTCYLISIVQHHTMARQMEGFNNHYLTAITSAAMPSQVSVDGDQPKARVGKEENIVQFSWGMPNRELFKEMQQQISSPKFWACGYKMQLFLQRYSNEGERFHVRVHLKVLGIRANGFASFSWKLKHKGKNLFHHDYSHDEKSVFSSTSAVREKHGWIVNWPSSESCVLKFFIRPSRTSVHLS